MLTGPAGPPYRFLFDAHPVPMWVFDRETLQFLMVNDAAVQQYGYAREEFLAMTLRDIRPLEDVPAFLQDLQHRGAGGRIAASRYRHRRRDGSVFEAEVSSQDIKLDGRNAILAMAMDVSERVRAEQALRTSRELLHAIVEGSGEAMFAKDLGGRYLMVNAVTARLLGRAVEDMLGRTDAELYPPDLARHFVETDQRVIRRGQAETGEETYGAGTEARTFIVTKGPLRDESGTIIGVFGAARDISERRRTEDLLRAALAEVKVLKGILPTCAKCKRIRNERGDWEQMESYVRARTNAEFSHGLCPDCARKDWGSPET